MTHDTTDLTNYYTGSQVDSKLNDYLSKTDADNNYYNKSEVDKKLTAASQNSNPGIFIDKIIKNFSASTTTTETYTTTEKCYVIFKINGYFDENINYTGFAEINGFRIATVYGSPYSTISQGSSSATERYSFYLNSGVECKFYYTDAIFFSTAN